MRSIALECRRTTGIMATISFQPAVQRKVPCVVGVLPDYRDNHKGRGKPYDAWSQTMRAVVNAMLRDLGRPRFSKRPVRFGSQKVSGRVQRVEIRR
jgi:hypothetical protein